MRYEMQLITDREMHYLPGITAHHLEQRETATHVIYTFKALFPDWLRKH